MDTFREFLKLTGASAVIAAALGFMLREIFKHDLKKRLLIQEKELETRSGLLITAFKEQLSADSAQRLATYTSQLATESQIRVEAYKNQLATESTQRIEAYKSALLTESGMRIETLKADLQKDVQTALQLATERQPAYQSLWALTATAKWLREEPLTPEARRDFAKELTDWYYTDGNGIFLSLEAGDLFLKARDLLTQPVIDDESIQRAFSLLKGQMKSDIAVYGPGDLETQIGTKPELRPRKDLAVIASNAPNQGV